ncbi:MAG: hypothetical protein J6A08_00195 [Lachnospiraceae bacterium]|nr:hypothetical protein [Lachnospiraceae bacterium]
MDLTIIYVVIILLMLPFVIIKGTRTNKKYEEALKRNKELETELKLLKQENYYLKKLNGTD